MSSTRKRAWSLNGKTTPVKEEPSSKETSTARTESVPVRSETTPTRTEQVRGSTVPPPSHPKTTRQFKLISVNFKEAALDSPSFRATVNHLDTQVLNIEKWLLALSSSVKKIPSYVKEVQSFCNSFLEHLVPTFIQDGLIDQEYTVQSLNTTLSGLKRLWGISLASLSVNSYVVDNVSAIVNKNVAHYKELRKKHEYCQEKYDKYLSIYVSTLKTKEAIMVMEDAKQLHQVRKEYIHSSLDLIIELSTLGNLLDKVLVSLSSDLWKHKFSNITSEAIDPFFKEQWSKIQKIQSWSDSYSLAIEKLQTDMSAARAQVEESSTLQFLPSSNINDYSTSTINSRTLNDIDERGIEKHGYLFMKTWVDKSNKPIWVRRWAFIKGGVFGLLVLSSSQTFVQETDKLGILLCSVKYAPNEDRRFCFEVKTSNMTVVFQAETLLELKSWLKVFENERTRILQNGDDHSDLIAIASGRYPPIVSEFSSTANTVMDRELTNTRIINSADQIITSSHLSNHIEKNEKYFQKHVYSKIPQIRPPFMTLTTKSSIVAYSLASATSLPTALTANIWGSVNWGLYYLHDGISDPPSGEVSKPEIELIQAQMSPIGDSGIYYPDYYPKTLVSLDIQMRALFETAVEPGEYCLASFRCIWSPNSKQELSGRCFITSHHIYFYMQALGFVALFKGYVGNLVSVDYNAQKSYDLLKIYNIDGVIKSKLFLDDGRLIKQKLVYLINNLASEKPKRLAEILKDLSSIEQQVTTEQKDQQKLKLIQRVPSFVSTKDPKSVKFQVDFRREYELVGENTYDLPPKALFHALLGDNSVIFKEQNAFATLESFIKQPWRKSENGDFYRSVIAPANYDNRRYEIRMKQVIDNISDNAYYTFTHEKAFFKFFFGSKFSVVYKFVIVGVAGKQSKVIIYSKRHFSGYSPFNFIIDRFCHQIAIGQARYLDKRLQTVVKEVGTHGMIVKAIYLYGKLSHTSAPEEVINEPIIFFGFFNSAKVVTKKLFHKGVEMHLELFAYVIGVIAKFFRSIRMNQFLVLIIVLLSLFNIFLTGKTTTSYWTARRASNIASEFLKKEPMMLQRAVYLKDTQELIGSYSKHLDHSNDSTISPSDSRCFSAFKSSSFVLNLDQPDRLNELYGDEQTLTLALNLKKAFRDIGVKRHELLVKLNILNSMEEEISKAEWRNWLMSELSRCDFISTNILSNVDANDSSELQDGLNAIMDYCNDCSAQLKYVAIV
ncbi:Snf1p protein-interacting protein [Scheffersomyces xylosifermentans]|uniref:Snf1p protein-interacting protein n=1 Tax=Scheffersomyces xylosifermentans TaxID=1304137 RepID=UPI00315C9384